MSHAPLRFSPLLSRPFPVRLKGFQAVFALALATLACTAQTQTIERMRMTDGDLTCAQLYAETQQMDMMMNMARSMPSGGAVAQAPQAAPAAPLGGYPAQQPGVNTGYNPAAAQQLGAAAAQTGNALGGLFAQLGQQLASPQGQQAMAQLGAQLGATQQQLAAQAMPQAQGALNQAFNQLASPQGNEQLRQMLLMSQDPRARAMANDPAALAQAQAALNSPEARAYMANPQLYAAMARAQAAGVNTGAMQGAAGLLGALQGAGNQQQAAAQVAPAAQNAIGGLFGALAGARGGNSATGNQVAGLFGNLLGAGQAPAAAAPMQMPAQAAPMAVAQQQFTPPVNQGAAMLAQAQARKDHLTSMFLSKGCKLSDVRR